MLDSETRTIATALIANLAPEELPLIDEILEMRDRPAIRDKEDILGSGIGDSWIWNQMASPALIAVAVWMTKDVLGKAVADTLVPRVKFLIDRLLGNRTYEAVQRSVEPDDEKLIQAIESVVKKSANEIGLSPDATAQLCRSIGAKMEALILSTPAPTAKWLNSE